MPAVLAMKPGRVPDPPLMEYEEMGRLGFAACLLVVILQSVDDPRHDAPVEQLGAALAVRIVPASYQDKTGRAIEGRFHVVVTNLSGRPVRLWKEWCSWGYFNLSFVATGRDGKTVIVKRKPRGWDKNYPDWSIVPPGGHLVVDVSFRDSTWQDAPEPDANRLRRVRLKAVYEIPTDEQTMKHGVWTGRVSSPEETYRLL